MCCKRSLRWVETPYFNFVYSACLSDRAGPLYHLVNASLSLFGDQLTSSTPFILVVALLCQVVLQRFGQVLKTCALAVTGVPDTDNFLQQKKHFISPSSLGCVKWGAMQKQWVDFHFSGLGHEWMPIESCGRYGRCLCTGYDIKVSLGKAQVLACLLDFSHMFTGYTDSCRGWQTADFLGCKWQSFRYLRGGYSIKWGLQRFPSNAEVCSYMVGVWWGPPPRTWPFLGGQRGHRYVCIWLKMFLFSLPIFHLSVTCFSSPSLFISTEMLHSSSTWCLYFHEKKSFCFDLYLYIRYYLYFLPFHFSVLFLITSWHLIKS